MGVKRVWSTAGVVVLTGALLLTSAPVASADYFRDSQWALEQFDVEKVWAESQGQGVTVAVVDTGVDGSHPDLTGQVLKGKDFTGGGDASEDQEGHGTAMASLIAGHGHGAGNAAGVMGLAPKAKILPVRFSTRREEKATEERWAAGVRYAVDNGASVINLSFADPHARTGIAGEAAIAYAQAHDVVVVAGTGNAGTERVGYPAALPGVVAVGAVGPAADGETYSLWDNSNTGPEVVLTAPGVNIVGANPTHSNGYQNGTGTSDATAYVSATAALLRAKFPDLTAGQVINRLIKSTTFLDHKVKKVPDTEYGYGMIRPYKALTMDIPKGSKQGPLGKVQAPSSTSSSGKASDGKNSSTPAAKKKSSSGSIFLIAGIAAVVVIGGIAIAVIRSRRNRGNGGPGGPGGGYPNQPPYSTVQQPYPTAAPGQVPNNTNRYVQQPPHQGQ